MAIYNLLADLIVLTHASLVLFILTGFFFNLLAFFRRDFFERWLFRTLHVFGVFFVGIFPTLGKPCPLTVLENTLRAQHDPETTYLGACIIHYVERFIYPDINPLLIIIPTYSIAFFTIGVYFLKPPSRVRDFLRLSR